VGLDAGLMPVNVPLPRYETLPIGVYFHREHPSDNQVILQIPNAERTNSETHMLDLQNQTHKSWVDGLTNSRQLLCVLKFAKHVAYKPSTGHCEEMPDLDAESYGAQLVTEARSEAQRRSFVDQLMMRRHNRSFVVPPFMQSLLGPR
jgi:hypothetical protein